MLLDRPADLSSRQIKIHQDYCQRSLKPETLTPSDGLAGSKVGQWNELEKINCWGAVLAMSIFDLNGEPFLYCS